jgi:hypothetical protein
MPCDTPKPASGLGGVFLQKITTKAQRHKELQERFDRIYKIGKMKSSPSLPYFP